jgi:hypothetical protein
VDGLYPLPSSSTPYLGHHVHGATKSCSTLWHKRLGHPSSIVVHQVLRDNSIPFSESNKESVCDACRMAKSHQHPYRKLTSVSTSPLELVFSDVWGLASESFGRFKYYVSFINDYSKFTWIHLSKKKSDVFQKFCDFQNHVERLFDKKIIAMQTDWEARTKNLTSFFNKWVFLTLFHVLMRINRMALLSVNIGIWWRLGYLSLLMRLCLSNIGMKFFSPQSI